MNTAKLLISLFFIFYTSSIAAAQKGRIEASRIFEKYNTMPQYPGRSGKYVFKPDFESFIYQPNLLLFKKGFVFL